MPQKIVPLINGEVYHVFNRGVDKRDVFLDKSDYLRFYQILNFFNSVEPVINFSFAKSKIDNGNGDPEDVKKLVEIMAYSLLPNHFHLIIKQIYEGGLSEFMRRISLGYTGYFNQRYERTGILFQGSFKRVHIESQNQYQYLFAYVNENHFVHNIKIEREICHTSSLHYLKITQSKLIVDSNMELYHFTENKNLAIKIAEKRRTNKADRNLLE